MLQIEKWYTTDPNLHVGSPFQVFFLTKLQDQKDEILAKWHRQIVFVSLHRNHKEIVWYELGTFAQQNNNGDMDN